jgi:hypothetical protein
VSGARGPHKVRRLSEEELGKFLFLHTEEMGEGTIMDLPLSRIVIHRYGRKVHLFQDGENAVVLTIELQEKLSGTEIAGQAVRLPRAL